jgi:hypothetical protein
MKYVLTWETRANASEEVDARSLQSSASGHQQRALILFSSSGGWTGGVVSRL